MLGCRDFGCVRVCRECAELPAFFVAGGTLSGELLRFRKVERKADARGRGGRQRERISARARTPSGDTTKVP